MRWVGVGGCEGAMGMERLKGGIGGGQVKQRRGLVMWTNRIV